MLEQTVCSGEDLKDLLAPAQSNLRLSRLTDAELIYTPSQIAMACVRAASEQAKDLVGKFLDLKEKRATEAALKGKAAREAWRQKEKEKQEKRQQQGASSATKKQQAGSNAQDAIEVDGEGKAKEEGGKEASSAAAVELDDEEIRAKPLGATRSEIKQVLDDIESLFRAREALDASEERIRATEIDKRLKACHNPEKTPGTRLHHLGLARASSSAGGSKKRKLKKEEKDPFDDDDDDENLPATFGPEGKKAKVEVLEGNLFKDDIEKGKSAK